MLDLTGLPLTIQQTYFTKAVTILGALMFLKAIASRNWMEAHITTI